MTIWDDIFQSRQWGRWPAEAIVRVISRFGRERGAPLNVLEVGCGPGAQVWYLAHEGHRATGVDISEVALRQAGRRLASEGLTGHAELALASACTLPFAAESFDVVIDVEAFSHNHEDTHPELWGEAARVLRSGGIVVSIGFTPRTFGVSDGRPLGRRTFADIESGPLQDVGLVCLREDLDALALSRGANLTIDEIQQRSWTTGPEHWLIEELIVVARKPA